MPDVNTTGPRRIPNLGANDFGNYKVHKAAEIKNKQGRD